MPPLALASAWPTTRLLCRVVSTVVERPSGAAMAPRLKSPTSAAPTPTPEHASASAASGIESAAASAAHAATPIAAKAIQRARRPKLAGRAAVIRATAIAPRLIAP